MKQIRNQLINLICESNSAKINGMQMALSSAKLHLNKHVQDCCICLLLVSDGHLYTLYMAYLLTEDENRPLSFAAVQNIIHKS